MPTHIAIIALTKGGRELAKQLSDILPYSKVLELQGGINKTFSSAWQEYESFVCIMAAGIVVRAIAPLLEDKSNDPSVVVCDEKGQFAISLLSGHLGGANALAQQVARALGGQAVITTASDVLGHTALDLWARELALTVADRHRLTHIMAKLVNNGSVFLYSDYLLPKLPSDIIATDQRDLADLLISYRTKHLPGQALLHPKTLVAGIGCNRGTSATEISEALQLACMENGLAFQSIRNLASIIVKKDEQGLLALAQEQNWPIDFYSAEQLNSVKNISVSPMALQATGAQAVAEPAAILSAGGGKLLVRKRKTTNVTVAIAELTFYIR